MTGPARPAVLRGVLLLAAFRAEGFAAFQGTPAALLGSLSPLLGFLIVGAAAMLRGGAVAETLAYLLVSVIALLAPSVLLQMLGAAWGVQDRWLRVAVAYNWCLTVFALLTVAVVGLVVVGLAVPGGSDLVGGAIGALQLYWLVLSVFMMRRGLGVSALRGFAAVLAINFGTAALLLGPRVIAEAMG